MTVQGGGGPILESPEEEAALEVSLPWLRPVAALLASYSYSCTHQVHGTHTWREETPQITFQPSEKCT